MRTVTRSLLVCPVALLLSVIPASAAGSDVADAVMHGKKDVPTPSGSASRMRLRRLQLTVGT